MTWTQNYDPFASGVLSPLIAALPIVLLLGMLASGRVPAFLAANAPWWRCRTIAASRRC